MVRSDRVAGAALLVGTAAAALLPACRRRTVGERGCPRACHACILHATLALTQAVRLCFASRCYTS